MAKAKISKDAIQKRIKAADDLCKKLANETAESLENEYLDIIDNFYMEYDPDVYVRHHERGIYSERGLEKTFERYVTKE